MSTERNNFEAPAVRQGDVYCAPWCGAGCTWKAFQKATQDASKLAASLGPGWSPYVWENMGWFYEAVRGVVQVTPSVVAGKVVGYTCFVQTDPQFIGKGTTAIKSVEAAASQFNAVVDALRQSLSESQLTLGPGIAVEELARLIGN